MVDKRRRTRSAGDGVSRQRVGRGCVGETRAEEARHKLDEMQAETKGCAGVPNLCRAEAVNRVVHNAGKAPYTFRDGIGAYVIPAHGAFLATDLLDGRVCGWEGVQRLGA